jgi:hypothetical protein
MTNRINPTESKVYRPTQQEEVDIMIPEREAYIQERYRDTIAYSIEQKKSALEKVVQRIMSWFS